MTAPPRPALRPGGPAAPHSVRRHNLALVLDHLCDQGPRSRAAIAQDTGLTKATVSRLVLELADRGLVREADVVQGQSGRPATLVEAADDRVVALGLEIDVDHLRVCAVDLNGRAHHTRVEAVDNRSVEPRRSITRLAALATDVLDVLDAEGRVAVGASVAVPGLVRDGNVLVAPNLGWQEVALTELLQRRLGGRAGPLRVDNEANLAALAEAHAEHHDFETFIFVSAGVGVGAGVVIDNDVFRGAHGFGGEFGHFVVDPEGRRCACGNRGCIETIVGKDHLLRATGHRVRRGAAPGDERWLDRLVAALSAGDAEARAALDHLGQALAGGLASTVSLFDPEAVVLGGFLTRLAPWIADPIARELEQRVLGTRWVGYPVVASRVGLQASVIGAALLSLREVRADPSVVPVIA